MKTYASKKVQIIYGGFLLTGTMDGTFVSAEKTTDDFTTAIGSDGEGARIQSADESGEVTFTLMQTSAGNDFLSNCRLTDKATGLGTKNLFVKDGSGRTLIHAAEAWIKKVAKVELADGKTGREWVISSANLEIFVGGN